MSIRLKTPISDHAKKNVSVSMLVYFIYFLPSVESDSGVHQMVSALSRLQLRGIDPWSSLPSSASITTEPINNWFMLVYLN
jgi:hypothetical protein